MRRVAESVAGCGLTGKALAARVSGPGLVERDGECVAIGAGVEAAVAGTGRLVFVEGPPGIGKTRLLDEARTVARLGGLDVLSACAAELEAGFPFGVARQLFEQRLRSASDSERASLLDGAAGSAAGLLGGPLPLPPVDPGDPSLALAHALYWLSANLAARRPVALLIDDAQWADRSSLRWLRYLQRRLDGLRMLVVVAARVAVAPESRAALMPFSADAGSVVLRPSPLSEQGCAMVVRERLGDSGTDAFCAACHEASGGNPFFVQELLRACQLNVVSPTSEAARHIVALAAPNISEKIALRIAGLAEGSTELASAVAVLGDGAALRHAATLAGLDQARAIAAADALARAHVLNPGEPLGFIHPLARSAVYDDIPDHRRSALHQRAARLLADADADIDTVAAQLVASAPAGSAWTVEMLRAAATYASERGAPGAAAAYLRRALSEPPERAQRGMLLFELGAATARAGEPGAVEHLREAMKLASDPVRRAHTALEVSFASFSAGDARGAVDVLTAAIDDVGDAEPELALRLHCELVVVADSSRAELDSLIRPRLPRLTELRQKVSEQSEAGRYGLGASAWEALARNDPADVVAEIALRALVGEPTAEERRPSALDWATTALILCDRFDDAEKIIERILRVGVVAGYPRAAATARAHRSTVAHRRGALAEAEVDARSVLEAGLEHAWPFAVVVGASWLLPVMLDRGRPGDALALLEQLGFDDFAVANFYLLAEGRGRARIAIGETRDGVEDLFAGGRWLAASHWSNPSHGAWRSHAALGLLALGEHDGARELADEELDLARAFGARRALGIALRARGLVDGSDGLELLAESVAVLERSQARLELARSLVEVGATLRRANRRAQAREPLRRGLELAHRCGAEAVVALARTELAATGARPRRPIYRGVDALTVSESRAARMAADGLTNPQIAQALFVTQKTVEKHLANSYTKLGIRSRVELPAALTAGGRGGG